MTAITTSDLTTAQIDGTGAFDVLMQANKAHLDAEFNKGRIKGPEYATVYLGSLNQVMQTALQFLLSKQKVDLEVQLLAKQIELADAQVREAEVRILQLEAQTLLVNQQKSNLIADALNIPKQGAKIDADTAISVQQKLNLIAEADNLPKQGLLIDANRLQATQQTANLVSQKLQVEAQTLLVTQQKANAIIEGTVLVAQECKLRAEYDLTMASVLKANEETSLLAQKSATERAQITALGVDADSVVGRQKALYLAQTNGFTRDAEQKAAKLLVDTWNVRRTTDETGTQANGTNNLTDADVGRAVTKLLSGVGA